MVGVGVKLLTSLELSSVVTSRVSVVSVIEFMEDTTLLDDDEMSRGGVTAVFSSVECNDAGKSLSVIVTEAPSLITIVFEGNEAGVLGAASPSLDEPSSIGSTFIGVVEGAGELSVVR